MERNLSYDVAPGAYGGTTGQRRLLTDLAAKFPIVNG